MFVCNAVLVCSEVRLRSEVLMSSEVLCLGRCSCAVYITHVLLVYGTPSYWSRGLPAVDYTFIYYVVVDTGD